MANLVVDIGNTALKAAWVDSMILGKTFRYQGEMIIDFILSLTVKDRPEIMVISSVVGINDRDRSRLEAVCGKLVMVSAAEYGLPQYLTPDRAASVLAAGYLFKGKGCTIVDFGSMITVDLIDKDGNYLGGNVSPGCRTRFKSVKRYSKSLPLLDTPDVTEELGTSLASSIESGVVSGIIFEISAYLVKYSDNIAIFTGGDAIYFAKRMKNSIFVVCNLVLTGLALIADRYVE